MSSKKGRFITGAAIGAAVAGTLALLFAPKAGKELRDDIANKAKEISLDMDVKIKIAKQQAENLTGDAKDRKLAMIARAESLKSELTTKSLQFSKSGKRVTKVAAREVDKMMQEGKSLIDQLDVYRSEALSDARKYAKKASKSTGRIVKSAVNEVGKGTPPKAGGKTSNSK